MALDPKLDDIHYLVGRLCAEVYPDSVADIPKKVTDKALSNPIEAIALLKLPNTAAVAEIMITMPADPPTYPHGAKIELQGAFWLGYYHQRAACKKARTMTPDDLAKAGTALFGERWQTTLAEALGFSDSARIRQMLNGRRRVSPGVAAEILAMLRQKSVEATATADELEDDA